MSSFEFLRFFSLCGIFRGKRKIIAIFEVFRAYLREILIFCQWIFMVARSNIERLLVSALLSLETRLKVPILVIFWQCLAFFKLFVLAQSFDQEQWFLLKFSLIHALLRVIRKFVMTVTIKPKIVIMQTRFSKILQNLCSNLAPIKCRFQF